MLYMTSAWLSLETESRGFRESPPPPPYTTSWRTPRRIWTLYGDSGVPAAQSAAITLAMSRAQRATLMLPRQTCFLRLAQGALKRLLGEFATMPNVPANYA